MNFKELIHKNTHSFLLVNLATTKSCNLGIAMGPLILADAESMPASITTEVRLAGGGRHYAD
jgi:hypothetical protein